jgi:hypothetical protein
MTNGELALGVLQAKHYEQIAGYYDEGHQSVYGL